MAEKYIFTNITGTYVFNHNLKIVDSMLFKSIKDYEGKDEVENRLLKKHNAVKPGDKELFRILSVFKDRKQFDEFRMLNMELAKKNVKESVNEDQFIIQAISNIEEVDKVANMLVKRLREWYELYNPEFSKSIENQEGFVKVILEKDKKQLLREINLNEEKCMGSDFSNEDKQAMLNLAEAIRELYKLRAKHEDYLEKVLRKYCPNLIELGGKMIAAKLIQHAGSLKRLARFPASTVQLLGAEKALFRHMKTKARCPKYGVIMGHPVIAKASKDKKGKAARTLADKLSMAARIDLYKGKFIGDKLRKEVEEKLK